MTGRTVSVNVVATGEVRDADGNLIDTPTVATTVDMPIEQARQLGLDPDAHEGDPA
jgi:hypothetical protein